MPSLFTLEGPRIPNGKSAGMPLDVFDPAQLAIGTAIELEHTTDPGIAARIAADHLVEDPLYYHKLRAVHLDGASIRRSWLTWLAVGTGIAGSVFAARWAYRKRRTLKRAYDALTDEDD